MPDKDAFTDLRKAKEEEFFRNREQALLEKLRQRAAAASDAQMMGDTLGTRDQQILEDLQALGYNRDVVKVLFALPLVAVAWADGEVSERERTLMEELSATMEGSENRGDQLKQWLVRKPEQEFIDRSLRIISLLLKSMPPDLQSRRRNELLTSITRIAEASGGVLGLGSISAAERAQIERVTREIEQAHSVAARTIAERL